MDPVPQAMAAARKTGADRVELYTESYARASGTKEAQEVLRGFSRAALAARQEGLGVNAGHDLNRDNLTQFLLQVPGVQEVSIGHALVSDALELGYHATVQVYLACIHKAFTGSPSQ